MSRSNYVPKLKEGNTPNSGRRIFIPYNPEKIVCKESHTYKDAKTGDHVWTCNECGRPRLYGWGWRYNPESTSALLVCFGSHSQHPNQHFWHTFMEIFRVEKEWTHQSKARARGLQ